MKNFRKVIEELEPYIPGKQIVQDKIRLNTNENPYPPPAEVLRAIQNISGKECQIYPNATANPVRATFAKINNLQIDQIIIGNGSDDVLTMIMRTFLDVGDKIGVVEPTYTLYQTLAAMQGATTEIYPLELDFSLPEAIFAAEVKIIFLPNPNAQTGNLFAINAIERLCQKTDRILVVDEAYANFAKSSVLQLIDKYPNLIITKTLSKSNSLAGLRVGFGVASPEIITNMMKVKDSYNVNAVSQLAALASLKATKYTAEIVDKIVVTREWFTQALCDRGWLVHPSAANFILTQPLGISPHDLVVYLEENGFLIRFFNTKSLKNYVRISMGTDQQMRLLLEIIDKITN